MAVTTANSAAPEPLCATAGYGLAARQGLENTTPAELFAWTEQDFESRLAGSPIRRIGHERWLRNIAVALGNTPSSPNATAALETRRHHPSGMLVREHVSWALSNIC